MDDFEGFKISWRKYLRCGRNIKRLELEAETEDVPELLQCHDIKISIMRLVLLMDKQRKWLEMKSTPGEDAMRIVEMTI